MLNHKWIYLLALLSLSIVHNVKADDNDDEIDVDSESEPETKEKFVPTEFNTPVLNKNSKTPYYFEYFDKNSRIGQTWIRSSAKKDGVDSEIAKYNGEWSIDVPTKSSIAGDFGLIAKTKARHHAIAAKLDKPYKFDTEKFVVQYDVKFEEGQECGGGYIKLLSEGAENDLGNFQDKIPYTVMFGPDKCGSSGRVHVIFRYKNPINGSIDEYHAKQPSSIGTSYWDDHQSHLYTLVVGPNGDFSVTIDGKSFLYGNMLADLIPSLIPPKQIYDPEDKKPEDWDERAEIEDETASKPDDWDENEPKEIVDENAVKPADWREDENQLVPDPEASKPNDWDDEMDGEWEAPMIDNPICKTISGCGKWKAPMIANPKYKGKWIRPKIANPAFKGIWAPRLIENVNYFEPKPYAGLAPITAVGIELWTMSENIVFDNILITSSEEDAADIAKQTFYVKQSEEYRMKSATGGNAGILKTIVDAANEKPWLWIVYVLCLVIPLIFLGVFCFGRQSKPAPVNYKKKSEDTVPVPDLVDDGEEPGPSGLNEAHSSAASSAEEQDDEDEEEPEGEIVRENEPVQPTEELARKSPKVTSGAKRRTARRGD